MAFGLKTTESWFKNKSRHFIYFYGFTVKVRRGSRVLGAEQKSGVTGARGNSVLIVLNTSCLVHQQKLRSIQTLAYTGLSKSNL